MSHKVSKQVEIYDLDLIKETLEELGETFVENAVWQGYYGHQREQCDVLVRPDRSQDRRYGVGFRQDSSGKLEIVQESMGGRGSTRLVQRFVDAYGIKAAIKRLESFGYIISQNEDGTYTAKSTLRTTAAYARRDHRRHDQQQNLYTRT